MARLQVAVIVLLTVCCPEEPALAQEVAPTAGDGMQAIARELRLLRQTIERRSTTTARAQLLVARITLQDQRTERARAQVDWRERELANNERAQGSSLSAIRGLQQSLEQATEQDERARLEATLRNERARLSELQKERPRIEAQLAQAKQDLEVETGRYEELDRWLNELDKQLEPAR